MSGRSFLCHENFWGLNFSHFTLRWTWEISKFFLKSGSIRHHDLASYLWWGYLLDKSIWVPTYSLHVMNSFLIGYSGIVLFPIEVMQAIKSYLGQECKFQSTLSNFSELSNCTGLRTQFLALSNLFLQNWKVPVDHWKRPTLEKFKRSRHS